MARPLPVIIDGLDASEVRANRASRQMSDVANLPVGSYIETDNGEVPSVAEWYAEREEDIGNVGVLAAEAAQSAADAEASADRIMNVDWVGEWETGTDYSVNNGVAAPDLLGYVALQDHTAGVSFEADLDAGYWTFTAGMTRKEMNSSEGASLLGVKFPADWSKKRTVQESIEDSISFLMFEGSNNNYESDNATAFEIAAVVSSQTNRTIYIPDGRYKISRRANIKGGRFRCSAHVVIDASESVISGIFSASGSAEPEIFTSTNIGSGSTVVQTVAPHGLQVGDWFLLTSQRVCSHPDAGPQWQLGSVTAGASHPYFAEPLQVLQVNSDTSVTTSTAVIFPSYRIDNSQETHVGVRTRSGIKKINFDTGFRFVGGEFIQPNSYSQIFDIRWSFRPHIDITARLSGTVEGGALYFVYNYAPNYKLRVTRPVNWVLPPGVDHSRFNSVRDVSSWYTQTTLDEDEGSQCYDQAYLDICGIEAKADIRAFNTHEQGFTTHGNVYGCVINAFITGARRTACSNRARFGEFNIRIRGIAGLDTSHGMGLHEFGQTDLKVTYNIENVYRAFRFDKSSSSITDGPEVISCEFTGSAANAVSLAHFQRRVSPTVKPSSIRFIHTELDNVGRAVTMEEGYWNGIDFDDTRVQGYEGGTAGFFQYANNTAFHSIRRFSGRQIIKEYLAYCPRLTDTDLAAACRSKTISVDWSTVNLTESVVPSMMDGFNAVDAVSNLQDVINLRLFNRPVVATLANTIGTRTITLNAGYLGMPVGSNLQINMAGTQSAIVAAGSGVTVLGSLSATVGQILTITRTGGGTYVSSVA